MKPRKHWYLLAYDIRNPKRLQRFHYQISKHALALQKSVFLVQIDRKGLHEIEQLVRKLTHTREDDVRLYPVRNPGAIWTAGVQDQAFANLFPNRNKQKRPRSRIGHLLHQLFG